MADLYEDLAFLSIPMAGSQIRCQFVQAHLIGFCEEFKSREFIVNLQVQDKSGTRCQGRNIPASLSIRDAVITAISPFMTASLYRSVKRLSGSRFTRRKVSQFPV